MKLISAEAKERRYTSWWLYRSIPRAQEGP